ncbi:peptidoglycan DD-metalloendopeptidase family protein [Paenibacillus sp. CAU 1782]
MKDARRPAWSFVVMRGADKSAKQFTVSKRSVVAMPLAAILAVTGTIAGLQIKAALELKTLEQELADQSAYFTTKMTGLNGVVDTKDDEIVMLQQEILDLSRQSQEMRKKVEELQELEQKLKLFIETYGSSTPSIDGEENTASKSSSSSKLGYEARAKTIVPLSMSSRRPQVAVAPEAIFSPAEDSSSTVGNASSASRHSNGSRLQTTRTESTSSFYDPSLNQMASLARQTGLDFATLGEMVDSMEISMAQTLLQAQQKRTTVDAYPSYWPANSRQLTSGFGYRKDPFTGRATFHAGIDINGKSGDAVFSAADGTVSSTGYDTQFGNYVAIDHLGGLQTLYMHLQSIVAVKGDTVVRGEKIGTIGSSGRSTGAHLHFQIMQSSEPVNPLGYLQRK